MPLSGLLVVQAPCAGPLGDPPPVGCHGTCGELQGSIASLGFLIRERSIGNPQRVGAGRGMGVLGFPSIPTYRVKIPGPAPSQPQDLKACRGLQGPAPSCLGLPVQGSPSLPTPISSYC